MKKLFTFLLITLLANSLNYSAAQNFEWAKSMGYINDDLGSSVCIDASGNVYLTGTFSGTVDFDPGASVFNLTSSSFYDIYIQKLDSNGNFLWAKGFGGSSIDYGISTAIDAIGNIYSTGTFSETADFDPGPNAYNLISNGSDDVFIQKLDSAGNFIWAKSFGGYYEEYVYSISVDAFGGVLTTGIFRDLIDIDPDINFNAYYPLSANYDYFDLFILKLDSSGIFEWAGSIGCFPEVDGSRSLTTDAFGNVYTTGFFQFGADFDIGTNIYPLISQGSGDIFIQKLDAFGNLVWANSVGGIGSDCGLSIAVDDLGNIYTTGFFSDSVDFDPGTNISNQMSLGNEDIFIQKLDPLGNFLWSKSMGGTGYDRGQSIIVDALGNVYTTGFFQGTVDFDPGVGIYNLMSLGNKDIFIQKLDRFGNFIWAQSIGDSIADDVGNSIKVDAFRNVYLTGNFEGTADFDFGPSTSNLSSVGNSDVFVLKLSPCLTIPGTDFITACNNYTWVDGITYTSSNSTATYLYTNAAGCDSVITLNLTILATASTDVITACDSYAWIDGITYTSSNNTATDTLINAAGCDSIITLNLTINSVSDITTTVNDVTITSNNAGNTAYQWLNCDSNFAIIVGENSQYFTALSNGNYAVELTENGCKDTSACVPVTTVGTFDNNLAEAITVSPNPNDGSFILEIPNTLSATELKIYNTLGEVVYQKNITSQRTSVNTSLSNGLYFLQLKTTKGILNKKVAIEK